MTTLKQDFDIDTLMVEGGGIINGTFLKAGLIDEISLVVYPGIDGLSSVPSIFEATGEDDSFPAQGQSLELLSMEGLLHGMVWLRYKVHKNA